MKKFFSLIALIVMATTITSCNPTPTPDPTPETLTASVTPSEITADGTSKAVFTVKYGDKAVSSVKAYVNGVETALTNLTFTTKSAGTYKFYFTYEWTTGKTVKSNEVSVTAKAAQASGDGSGLTMSVDNTIIQVNKGRATFTIKYNGKIVESGYKMYKNGTETTLPTTEVTIDGKKYKQPYFESKTTGTFSFKATYNYVEKTNGEIVIQVNNDAIPDSAEDPNPSSTSFKHRAMVMQFTGTECGYCPYMIEPLEQMAADTVYKDKFSWAAIHTYNPNSDPAAPCVTSDQQKLESTYGVKGYPSVFVDIGTLVGNMQNNIALNLANLKKAVDNSVANPASAGISATMTLDENNRVVTARVRVKAKDAKVYNVSMWLLEDNIKGGQAGSSTITSHDHAVRYVARGADNSASYIGYPLNDGKAMTAGQIADYIFSINISNQSIKLANCKLVFFVTTSTGNSYTVVNSVVSKDLKTAVPFEYNE